MCVCVCVCVCVYHEYIGVHVAVRTPGAVLGEIVRLRAIDDFVRNDCETENVTFLGASKIGQTFT